MAQILVHGSNRSWGFSWLWTSWTVLLCTDTDNICNIPPGNFGILRSWLRQFAITPWQELIGCTQPRACQKRAAPVSISMDQLDSIGSMACKNLACSGFCQQKVQPSPVQSHFSTVEVTLFTYDLSWQQPWILGGKRATCGAGSNAWKGDS